MGLTTSPDPTPPVGEARRARLALFALLVGWAACLWVALTPDPEPPFVPPPQATSDLDLYERIVARVSAGEGYYAAAHRELLTLGYPTRSVFNWRLPTYAWLFAAAPSAGWCRGLLMLGALLAVLAWGTDLLREGGIIAAGVGGVFLVGSMAWCCGGQTFLFTELWAGILIALSLAAFRRGWTGAGVGCGLAAVLFRELALPYLVISLVLAIRRGRRREALAWTAGLLVFTASLGVHRGIVLSLLTDADQGMVGGWLRFRGLRFVLATAQADVFLMSLPLWVTAVYVPLATLGLLGWTGESAERARLTGLAYLGAYCIVGAPFNFYWGFVDAPLLALGIAHAPGVLARLWHTAGPSSPLGRVTSPIVRRSERRRWGKFATAMRAR